MRKPTLDILVIHMVLGVAVLALASPSNAGYVISEIIDATGDGVGNTLDHPYGIAVDSSGNVYVTGGGSRNAFKIAAPGTCSASGTPCTITEIIDATGDGSGNTLDSPVGIAVDSNGNVYVAASNTHNAFRITPSGTITEIIDATGDGGGNALDYPYEITVDSGGNVYVAGYRSDNAFKIATPGTCSTSGTPCTVTEIIDATGAGGGRELGDPVGIAVDSSGNVYLTGGLGYKAFRIATPGTCSTSGTPCTITEIIQTNGDRRGNTLYGPAKIAVDLNGNVYVAGTGSENAFKIARPGTCSTSGTPCRISEIIDTLGDGRGNALTKAWGVAVDSSRNVYVAGWGSHNAFKIVTPVACSTGGSPCTISEIIDATGDGSGHTLDYPRGIAVDSSGNVYVAGGASHNAFKIQRVLPTPVLSNQGLVLLGASLLCVVSWVARRQRMMNA